MIGSFATVSKRAADTINYRKVGYDKVSPCPHMAPNLMEKIRNTTRII
jgi:hypothetical protein